MDIRFLLLDEPIAGLNDERNRPRSASSCSRCGSEFGFGILVVEHNMPFVSRLCDRLVVLDLGELIAERSPAEVLGDPKVHVLLSRRGGRCLR